MSDVGHVCAMCTAASNPSHRFVGQKLRDNFFALFIEINDTGKILHYNGFRLFMF